MNARLKKSKIALLGTLVAGLVLPAQSLAEYYVPPGNSAANQYTEAFPTAGGESGGKRGHGKEQATPAQTLGARNAKRLEAEGPAGAATAAVAAETAPPAALSGTESGGNAQNGGGATKRSPQGGSAGSGGPAPRETAPGASPSGSSGLGEVVAQATGSADDGNLGLLLPIVILATIAGSIAYRARLRHGPTA